MAAMCTNVQNDRKKNTNVLMLFIHMSERHVAPGCFRQQIFRTCKSSWAGGETVGILSKITVLMVAVLRGIAQLRFPDTTRAVSSPLMFFFCCL